MKKKFRFFSSCLVVLLTAMSFVCSPACAEMIPLSMSIQKDIIIVSPLLPAAPAKLKAVFGPDYPTTTLTWKDNSSNETGFEIWRRTEGAGDYELLKKTAANVTSEYDRGESGLPGEGPYMDLMLQLPNTTFYYKVRAYNAIGFSAFSNESSYTTPEMPADVSGLKAKILSDTSVQLSWKDNSDNETGFMVHRGPKLQEPPGDWGQFCKDYKLAADTEKCTDTGLVPGKTYIYTVHAYNPYQSNICNTESVEVTPGDPNFRLVRKIPLTIKLHLHDPNMEINGVSQEIDPGNRVAPVIVDGRLMLPVRALIESMGGTLSWDESEKKVVIENGAKRIELWIGSNITRIDGVEKHSDVPPAIINSRTMLPLRFITENLGCTVRWDEATHEAIVETE